jgi:pilus assembly protein CpaF
MVISGGTGTGKTTFINALSALIPKTERIITIEDAAELQLDQEHVVSLESRAPDRKGEGAVTIRDLLHSSLRMRPDRIIVGECRGGEALDLLQAMNTGHGGSMSTLHANSPIESLRRLETLALFSGEEIPLRFLRAQVASAIDIVVQLQRLRNKRAVQSIAQVMPLTENGEYEVREIFTYDYTRETLERVNDATFEGEAQGAH